MASSKRLWAIRYSIFFRSGWTEADTACAVNNVLITTSIVVLVLIMASLQMIIYQEAKWSVADIVSMVIVRLCKAKTCHASISATHALAVARFRKQAISGSEYIQILHFVYFDCRIEKNVCHAGYKVKVSRQNQRNKSSANHMLNQESNTRVLKLSDTPTELNLHELMSAATENKGAVFSCSFKKAAEKYELSLVYVEQLGGTFEWRMFTGEGSARTELWFHLTSDLMLVLNMILEVLGESPANQSHQEQAMTYSRMPSLAKLRLQQAGKSESPTATGSDRRPKLEVSNYLGNEIPVTATFDTVPIYVSEELMRKQEHLTGSLDVVHITNLLQSISLGQMTGRLRIQRPLASVDIYFEDGTPVHAAGTQSTGEECILQVICWKDGQFDFEPNVWTKEQTITQGINSLILHGVQLSDNTELLKRSGISMQSVLSPVHARMTEAEFEQLMLSGEPVEMRLLKAFYLSMQPGRTLQEIVTQLNLQRSQWVQVAANLIRCKAIRLDKVSKKQILKAKTINKSMFDSVTNLLVDARTGLLTYGALLFLLNYELNNRKETPFSFLLFDVEPVRMGKGDVSKAEVLQSPAFMKALAIRIQECYSGYLGHYENHELALLVPGMDAIEAAKGADKIRQSLLSAAGLAGIEASNLSIGIGVVGYPRDATALGAILAAVETARTEAKRQGCAVILARHIF